MVKPRYSLLADGVPQIQPGAVLLGLCLPTRLALAEGGEGVEHGEALLHVVPGERVVGGVLCGDGGLPLLAFLHILL